MTAVPVPTDPRPIEAAPPPLDELERRREELAPLYDAAILTLGRGFRLGAGLLAIGLAWALVAREPLAEEADPFAEIVPTILDGRAAGVIDLALLALMATPVVAVLVVAAGFVRLGDRRYAILSGVVLAILGVSIGLALFR